METLFANSPVMILVFIRISGFIAMVPFFKNRNFIMPVKAFFALMITVLIFPTLNTQVWVIPSDLLSFILLVLNEVLIGVLMGLMLLILLFGLELAGHFIGFQMAFSMARAVDVTMDTQSNVIGVLLVLTGTMFFLALGGDHYLLYNLKGSYSILPPGEIIIGKSLIKSLSASIMKSFVIGFKLAAPAIVILLCVDITLGIIGKTASKMQIFFVGLPLKISLGLFLVSVILVFVKIVWGKEIEQLPDNIMSMFQMMRG